MAETTRNGLIVDSQTVTMSSHGIITVRFEMFEYGVVLNKVGHLYSFSVDSETQGRWIEENIVLELVVSEDYVQSISYEDYAIVEYYIPKALLD